MTAEHPLPIRIPGGTVFGGDWTDPGPLPAEVTTPEFLTGVQQDWHAIDPPAIRPPSVPSWWPGCHDHAGALCGVIVRIAKDDLQPYRAGEWPVAYDRCPECRWIVAARTGTLHEALAELADPLANAVAAAILDKACRDLLEDDGRTLDDPQVIQLLACVSRHEPGRLVYEGCAEGDHDGHEAGQCPGRDACAACSLQAGSWAGEWEGQFLDECTIVSPCGPLLALAAHFAVEVPGA